MIKRIFGGGGIMKKCLESQNAVSEKVKEGERGCVWWDNGRFE